MSIPASDSGKRILDVSRRGNPEFAGQECGHEGPSRTRGARCTAFARYEVIAPESQEAHLSCGAHLAEFIRGVWLMTGNAAIVKEVPGMWRTSRAS